MRFLVISHSKHKQEGNTLYGYTPYVREMNLWLKYVDEVEIIAPKTNETFSNIETAYQHSNLYFNQVPFIEFTSFKKTIISLLNLPKIVFTIYKAIKKADHVHLRCPGNIGLLGCLVQAFFPKKIKTAKYAGNWDPKSKQPISYCIQKWILSNTLLTKNIQVLVYGEWKYQTKNIKPFFTASFYNSEIESSITRYYDDKLNFIFIGSLVKGKRPLLAIKIIERLNKEGRPVSLKLYGDGILKAELEDYIVRKKLESIITIKGNKKKEVIKEALKKTHFLLLPSKSEGWPKAVSEAMFFGVIPITTKISCLPFMLDRGKRGILIEPVIVNAVDSINTYLENKKRLKLISESASDWSHKYTLDVFETEIIKLLKGS
ncbi:glycosyltransferase family 4 protein [Flavivirga sp. 57AJ16]|uniref:glycosyltransferase family 4 protein n=1 Tax=Flavivirga sp. 57AJ16 TaxID=3025307 RepID=UPI00236570AA|nr:glycosyltransferase [Flavivirga sp. 57AJ16]MDD7885166.1 glycosyltransferase [Flavivirga sp. 57AJ16]